MVSHAKQYRHQAQLFKALAKDNAQLKLNTKKGADLKVINLLLLAIKIAHELKGKELSILYGEKMLHDVTNETAQNVLIEKEPNITDALKHRYEIIVHRYQLLAAADVLEAKTMLD